MDIKTFLERTGDWLMTSGLRVVLIIVLAFIALWVARIISNRIFGAFRKASTDSEAHKRADTLSSLLRYVTGISVIAIATVMVLGELGIQIGPILAAAGIVGLAVGFGAQNLVQDVIGGFFILLDDSIRVGDVVEISGKSGLVERVNLRMTILRDLAGNVHYVRNGQVEVVTNMTKEYSQFVFDIGVAYREDFDEVIKVIKKVDEQLRADPNFGPDILEPIEVLGLDKFADSAIIIKARTKTRPIKQWRVAREFNRRLKKAFDENNIEIPFPHMTLYAGRDKQGKAAPIHVSIDDRQVT